jgi:hypothetical protein
MAMTAEEILEQARALSPRERLRLAARLVSEAAETEEGEPYPAELEEPATKAELDRELARRIRLARAGHTVPAEDVVAELRARRR